MRKIFWLARREYITSVRTKSFIIGLFIAPVMMSGSGIAFALLKDNVDVTDKNLAVMDRSGIVAEALVESADARNADTIDEGTGEKKFPAYMIEVVAPNEADLDAQRLELSNRVRQGELHAFVEIGPDILHPGDDPDRNRVTYHAKNAAVDEVRNWFGWPINRHLRMLRLKETGADESAIDGILRWSNVDAMGLITIDRETGTVQRAKQSSKLGSILPPVVMIMLMFFMIMMAAVPQVNAVMEEKSQRIAEVMLGSASPSEFMAGKLLGGLAISLTGSLVYVVGGIVVVTYLDLGEHIPWDAIPWFFVFMVSSILMMGSMAAGLGAACNNMKDAQSLMFPILLPAMIPMFIMMPVTLEPTSSFASWMSLVPFFTPFLMTLRIASPMDIPMWQPWLGLAGVLLVTSFSVWAGGRIFRVGILMQGTPPKLGNLIRWALRG